MWHHPKVLDNPCRIPYNVAIVKVLVGSFRLLLQQTCIFLIVNLVLHSFIVY